MGSLFWVSFIDSRIADLVGFQGALALLDGFGDRGIAVGCNSAVGNALVTDLVPHPSLGKGLALFSATSWVGGVIGFALGGILLQSLDLVITCRIAASLGLVAVGLLIPIRVKQEGAEQTLRP